MLLDRVTNLNDSTKTAMSAALVIAAAVAAYGWVLSPHVAYLRAVQKYEPVVGDVAKQKIAVSGALGAKRRRLERAHGELAILREKFFSPTEAMTFFGDLEALAQKNGCIVGSIDLAFDNGSQDKKRSTEFVITAHHANLYLTGQYGDLAAALAQLQGRPQEVWIESCWIEPSDAYTGLLKSHITLTIWVVTREEDQTHG